MLGLCCIQIYFIRFYVAVGFMLFSLMWGVYVVQFDVAMGFMLFGLMPLWGYVVGFDVTVGFMLFGLMSPWGLCCSVWCCRRIYAVNVTKINVVQVYFVQDIFGVPHEMGRWHNTFVYIINHLHIEAVYINIEHMLWHWHKVVSAFGEMT